MTIDKDRIKLGTVWVTILLLILFTWIAGCKSMAKTAYPIPLKEIPVRFMNDTTMNRWHGDRYRPWIFFIYMDENSIRWQLPTYHGPQWIITTQK